MFLLDGVGLNKLHGEFYFLLYFVKSDLLHRNSGIYGRFYGIVLTGGLRNEVMREHGMGSKRCISMSLATPQDKNAVMHPSISKFMRV